MAFRTDRGLFPADFGRSPDSQRSKPFGRNGTGCRAAALINLRRERSNVSSGIQKAIHGGWLRWSQPSAVEWMTRLVSIGKVVGHTRNYSLRTPYVGLSAEIKNSSTSSAQQLRSKPPTRSRLRKALRAV